MNKQSSLLGQVVGYRGKRGFSTLMGVHLPASTITTVMAMSVGPILTWLAQPGFMGNGLGYIAENEKLRNVWSWPKT